MEFEALVYGVCERPGMYAGWSDFLCAVCWIDGVDFGIQQGQDNDQSETARLTVMRDFSRWLYAECFPINDFALNQHYSPFLRRLFSDDAEAFRVLALLFREFKDAERDAGGREGLIQRRDNAGLTFDEYINLADEEEEDEDEEWFGPKWEARLEEERNGVRALLRNALDASARGEERPLAAHISKIRAGHAEHKARAAALLKAAQEAQTKTP